ncbi:unnamed protein product [Microthlaspi erraticum]|uniref:Uncharacterized protein n=1 Tax=Microthlaspi erraticum TaxID=1685480 RepID=A0A6D2KW08_9BRAS|nr:unnamed protein product [Microthlaspi erraticum]
MDIKFCKTNLLIEHKELDGRFQFKFTHPLLGMRMICEKRSLSSIELSRAEVELRIELNIRSRSADLGEPECYYFEEYEAPRMNPSVVAATRGLDFSKSSTNGKGKPLRRCKSPWTRW